MRHDWCKEELQRDWYLDSLQVETELALEAFVTLDALFGTEWIREWVADTRGPAVTLRLIVLGICAKVLPGATNTASLLEKLKRREPSAIAEVKALALCVRHPDIQAEVEPLVKRPGRPHPRCPDFRIRKGSDAWTYVEVSAPNAGKFRTSLETHLLALINELNLHLGGRDVRVTLAGPNVDAQTVAEAVAALKTMGQGSRVLSDGSIISLAQSGIALVDHPSKIADGFHLVLTQGGRKQEQIRITVPFTDERAAAILEAEAKQLPDDSPTVIMIEGTSLHGSIADWTKLLRRRLQPNINTRIGALCIFTHDIAITTDPLGLRMDTSAVMVDNPHARFPVPSWVLQDLRNATQLR